MKRRAIYPGSFDPITNGHVDIIRRGLHVFDEIIIVVAENPRKNKTTMFTTQERLLLIQKVFAKEKRVTVDICSGLIMDYARKKNVKAMIRGLRATGDFENEFMMASMNRDLNTKVETVFLVTGTDLFFVSSSLLKEIFYFGGNVKDYVPQPVWKALQRKRVE